MVMNLDNVVKIYPLSGVIDYEYEQSWIFSTKR
jgi:hypothetical protein